MTSSDVPGTRLKRNHISLIYTAYTRAEKENMLLSYISSTLFFITVLPSREG